MRIALVCADPGEVTRDTLVVIDPFAMPTAFFTFSRPTIVAALIQFHFESAFRQRAAAISACVCLFHAMLYILVTLISQII